MIGFFIIKNKPRLRQTIGVFRFHFCIKRNVLLMEQILTFLFEQFKEFNMQYGLWETVLAYALLGFVICVAWRLPNIIIALKEWKK